MKQIITTKAVYDYDGNLIHWEGFIYDGPVELAGGGPDKQQRAAEDRSAQAAQETAQLARERQARQTQFENQVLPFYQSRMTGGLPYLKNATDYTGALNAQAYAPARASLQRRLSTATGLPSGYADQALTDFDVQRGHAFDSDLLNLLGQDEQAREYGASGVGSLAGAQNPLGYYGTEGQLNQSIINAPRRPGIAGTLGGLAAAGAQTAAAFA